MRISDLIWAIVLQIAIFFVMVLCFLRYQDGLLSPLVASVIIGTCIALSVGTWFVGRRRGVYER